MEGGGGRWTEDEGVGGSVVEGGGGSEMEGNGG